MNDLIYNYTILGILLVAGIIIVMMYGYYNKKLDEDEMIIVFKREELLYYMNKNVELTMIIGKLKQSTKISCEEMSIYSVPKDSIIYLSGPITGTDDSTERFGNAAKQLKLSGFNNVINPQKLIEVYMYQAKYEHYIDVCMTMINHTNVILMLKGWEHSPGACRERDKAISNGLKVVYE